MALKLAYNSPSINDVKLVALVFSAWRKILICEAEKMNQFYIPPLTTQVAQLFVVKLNLTDERAVLMNSRSSAGISINKNNKIVF